MKTTVAMFGCKSTTRFILDALLERGPVAHLVTISPAMAEKNDVADYDDLCGYAASKGVVCHVAASYGMKDPLDTEAIRAMGIDLAFVIGWQRLIPADILEGIRIGAFGMHGSADNLPKGRGRSPMNWSIIEGRGQFFTNLFRYDPGVDSGAVLDTFRFSIRPEDTAETMHFKNALAMKRLIARNIDGLLQERFTLNPQDGTTPTFYPKRTPEDSIIDWRLGISEIERFIRAVAPPFNGAFTYLDGKKITINRAAIFETDGVDFGQSGLQPGSIMEIFPNGKWLVRCDGGILLIHEYVTSADMRPGKVCVSPEDRIRPFPRNERGTYDIEA